MKLFVLCFLFSIVYSQYAEVQTKDGWVKGIVEDDTRVFRGIPYAKPPVGDLRWRRPTKNEPWNGFLNTLSFAPDCVNSPNVTQWTTNQSEDCLYLNVYTPVSRLIIKRTLPVMVFFYGGSFIDGASSFPLYDGKRIVNLRPEVVVVTVNYRLGVFGFFANPYLQSEDVDASTGNYGLLDQQLALKWVRDNIESFGGDSSSVTIFGQSAGAGSVSCHLVAESSFGLYNKAIAESGPFVTWISRSLSSSVGNSTQVLKSAGCNTGNNTLDIACGRNLTVQDLLNYGYENKKGMIWSPTIDNSFLKGDPQILAQQGKFNQVPTIIGSNLNDASIFVEFNKDVTQAQLQKLLLLYFGQNITTQILKIYPFSNYKSPYWCGVEIQTDLNFRCPSRRSLRWLSQKNQNVYGYIFSHELLEIALLDSSLGVFHGSELMFVFNKENVDLNGYPIHLDFLEKDLSHLLVYIWTNFAIYGYPKNEAPLQWPRYHQSTDLLFNINLQQTITANLSRVECDFWDTIVQYHY